MGEKERKNLENAVSCFQEHTRFLMYAKDYFETQAFEIFQSPITNVTNLQGSVKEAKLTYCHLCKGSPNTYLRTIVGSEFLPQKILERPTSWSTNCNQMAH